MARVMIESKHYRVDPETGCWIWLLSTARGGYGQIGKDGKKWRAHRLSYIEAKGEIAPGLVLDHLCRRRDCINPDHLEPVTHKENLMRGVGPTAQRAAQTHCLRGHPFDEENTVIKINGCRWCAACGRLRDEAKKRKRIAS